MPLNENIIDLEKPDGICWLTLVVNELSGFFYMHQSFLLYIQDLHK